LTPPSYAILLSRMDAGAFGELARRFAVANADVAGDLKRRLIALARPPMLEMISKGLSEIEDDRSGLHELHEAQAWRLAHWRTSRESLTYRRFFEISDLVGVRVENPRVFDDVHRLILSLVEQGAAGGLRIDHIDGLADPLGYLKRLQNAIARQPFYLVVEKILGPEEEPRPEWPVAGTTGYEFIKEMAGLFVDQSREAELTRAYAKFVRSPTDYRALVIDLKRRTLTRNLAGELDALTSQAHALAQRNLQTRDYGADTLRRAIIELATALPIYRTYIDASGPRPQDLTILQRSAKDARASREVEDDTALDFIVNLLTLSLDAPDAQAAALAFAGRFQQTTGPLMAKAVEDTIFYRYNPLIALNEVGGEPHRFGGTLGTFHAAMQRRQKVQPLGLSTTSTHDTKRGEDGRARIYAISEMPQDWDAAVCRWSAMNAKHRRELADAAAPEPEMEWFFYQSLLGVWPPELDLASDPGAFEKICVRMEALMEKAAREAKLRTSWTQPAHEYEQALASFVERVLDPARSREFLMDFRTTAAPLMLAGAINSLSQLLIKLFAPGVPDVYQGSELWDLTLVDPDNRGKVDYACRSDMLAGLNTPDVRYLVEDWTSGTIKMHVLHRGLRARRRFGDITRSAYLPIEVRGEGAQNVVAFARELNGRVVVAVAVRLSMALVRDQSVPLVPPDRWGGTMLVLPPALNVKRLRNAFTDEELEGTELSVSDVLRNFTVALLAPAADDRLRA
jgi:(1->4)-alpha-D-glucan 1-alpha-D-glucosylmutase